MTATNGTKGPKVTRHASRIAALMDGEDAPKGKKKTSAKLAVTPLRMQKVRFRIRGTTPMVISRFGKKAFDAMADAMAAPPESEAKKTGTNKPRSKRPPRDYEAEFHDAYYRSKAGWYGLSALSMKNALISACRLCDIMMTRAKLAIFISADGTDRDDGTPLIKIVNNEPRQFVSPGRNADDSIAVRSRAWYDEGWEAIVVANIDLDQLSPEDFGALLMRAGLQVGVHCGRADSKKSIGCGWGHFEVIGHDE